MHEQKHAAVAQKIIHAAVARDINLGALTRDIIHAA